MKKKDLKRVMFYARTMKRVPLPPDLEELAEKVANAPAVVEAAAKFHRKRGTMQ